VNKQSGIRKQSIWFLTPAHWLLEAAMRGARAALDFLRVLLRGDAGADCGSGCGGGRGATAHFLITKPLSKQLLFTKSLYIFFLLLNFAMFSAAHAGEFPFCPPPRNKTRNKNVTLM
jgi:hypothetical protein